MDTSVYNRMAELEAKHWWFTVRRDILTTVISRLNLPFNARILDAGCGTGSNIPMLSCFGTVTGLDFSPIALAYTKQKGFSVVQDSLPDTSFSQEYFDLITAFDLLEHIEDDSAALISLAKLLKPKSTMVLTVPINPWMWSSHDIRHHHYRRYTWASIRELTETAGLSIRRQTCFNTLLFPLITAIRVIRTWLKRDNHAQIDDSMPPHMLNIALQAIFRLEKHLLARTDLPFGVSCMVVAERSHSPIGG